MDSQPKSLPLVARRVNRRRSPYGNGKYMSRGRPKLRDPTCPPVPVSPFDMYRLAHLDEYMKANPKKSTREYRKHIRSKWCSLSDEEQAPYIQEYVRSHEKFKAEMREYSPLPGYTREGKSVYRRHRYAKKRKKTHPNAPKRPRSGFLLWQQQQVDSDARLRAMYSNMTDLKKEISRRWRACTEEDKKPFQEEAKKLKVEYDEKKAEFYKKLYEPSLSTEEESIDSWPSSPDVDR